MRRDNIKEDIKQLRSVFENTNINLEDEVEKGSVYGSDIYQIFENLYNLFNNLKLLSNDPLDISKSFKFIHAYPDEVKSDDVNVITFRVKTRAPAVSSSKAVNQTNFTSKAPRVIDEVKNEITGMVEYIYQQAFDNVIALTIFSTKARAVNLLAQIIESIFVKYKKEICSGSTQYFYLGMSDIGFLDRYDQEPIFTRELVFHFKTSEMFKMESEEVKSINID